MAANSAENEQRIPTMGEDDAEKAADFANYFCTYAYLYHQKQMLTDRSRMHSYHSAIMNNSDRIRDKVVLDVGTGTGVLAMWAAKAGARKVYAVEYTGMARYAERLVQANQLENVVTVIKASVEELDLPEKVDVIISEWMGYFLLRESMLDSVLVARDKHLKEDGIMMPSHATMYLAPITFEEDRTAKHNEFVGVMHEWEEFQNQMKGVFDISVDCLLPDFLQEQRHYYLLTALWSELCPDHVKGTPQVVKHLDLKTCTLEDAKGIDGVRFNFGNLNPVAPEEAACISGFAGWFTTDFRTGDEQEFVTLDTSPMSEQTHWGQQVFYLPSPAIVPEGHQLSGEISMVRQRENKRLYNVGVRFTVSTEPDAGLDMQPIVWELP